MLKVGTSGVAVYGGGSHTPASPPPPTPALDYPIILPSGPVVLPASADGILFTLSRVVGPAATSARPVARSYDGHGWEALAASPLPPASAVHPETHAVLAYDRSNASNQFDACELNGGECEVVLPADTADCPATPCAYRLDRYDATELLPADADARTRRAAARLLLQATFGPTRALLDGPLGSDASPSAMRAWLEEQTSLPATTLRSYVRRATNPRVRPDVEGTLVRMRARAVCTRCVPMPALPVQTWPRIRVVILRRRRDERGRHARRTHAGIASPSTARTRARSCG